MIEGLFGNDPNALMAMPISVVKTYVSVEKVGYALAAYVPECAGKKTVLRFLEDGNDQALANIDVETESPCGVSIDDPDADSNSMRDHQHITKKAFNGGRHDKQQ